MLYVTYYMLRVYLLTELTNWLVLSVQRSVMKMITANARCICCFVVVVVESCPTSGFIMPLCGKSIHFACGKRTRGNVLACCNTPAKRLYLEKLFQYLHFLLLQLSSPYRNLWVVRLFTHIYVYICWPCTNNTHHHHHQATAALTTTTTTITSTATTRGDRADCLSIDWQMSI